MTNPYGPATGAPAPGRGPEAVLAPTIPESVESWLERRGLLVDIVLASLGLVLLGGTSIAVVATGYGTLAMITGTLAAIGMPAALAVRRPFPVASAVAVNALALLHFAGGGSLLPVDVLIYLSVYSTTVHGPRWARLTSLGSALLGSLLVASTLAVGTGGGRFDTLVQVGFVFVGVAAPAVVSWALGLLRLSTRQRRQSLLERAARAERERDQQATIAVAAERARIAREMHDVVAHSLSIVVAQADGGRYVAAQDPQAAARVLETIGSTGRGALRDMRRILGVLRDDDASPTAPQPGAEDIDALVASVRDSGLEVELVRTGAVAPLPAGMGLAVYRICQEALTNVMKHAGPLPRLHVRVDLAFHPGWLVVQVDDDGRGASGGDGAGHGLVGMRERVALFGGTLTAGPRPGGGYRVNAAFPLASGPG
ncbi:sensor histidine kinase [Litorihabitans aurantiacus]|uniref:histidine kinase n=1 Tax=Litorihabitans aurantiacus TaxID=1930061 RepID=A0AA37XFB7_9MICO|nr:histidine kinase [Litorihabitans aurantiacus]GMA32074.1 two-component sensor histidine kinase [Litorihabitans aurantiacus]